MRLLDDVTVGEGESIPPSTSFTKTWTVVNSGADAWPDHCVLLHVDGAVRPTFGGTNALAVVPALLPGEVCTLSAQLTSPTAEGVHQSRWRLHTANGVPFGDIIWCIVTVDSAGLLGITQQMAGNCVDGSAQHHLLHASPEHTRNPFGATSNVGDGMCSSQ